MDPRLSSSGRVERVLYRGTRTCRAVHPKHNDQAIIVEKVEIKDVISDIISNSVPAALEHGCPYRNLAAWNRGVIYKPEYANLRKVKACIQCLTEIRKKPTIGAASAQRIIRSHILRPG